MAEISIELDAQRGSGYILRAACHVPREIDEVFPYFADAANLEKLTPSWLRFQIVTPQPIEMDEGTRMDYKLRIRGIPLRWQSKITAWQPPRSFVDEAVTSPYKYWRHEHRFEPTDRGTRVIDVVHYDVPGGRLIHWLAVGRDLRAIFNYRQRILAEHFNAERTEQTVASHLASQ